MPAGHKVMEKGKGLVKGHGKRKGTGIRSQEKDRFLERI